MKIKPDNIAPPDDRKSAKRESPTSRAIPASAGPIPRSHPDTRAAAGQGRSEHWIEAPYFPSASARKPHLSCDPCERRSYPAEPPEKNQDVSILEIGR